MASSQQQTPDTHTVASQAASRPVLLSSTPTQAGALPIPVKAQGISLYALWYRNETPPRPPLEVIENIAAETKSGVWSVVRLIWHGTPTETDIVTTEDIFQRLQNRLDMLYPSTPPIYCIFHINSLIYTAQRRFLRQAGTIYEKDKNDMKMAFRERLQEICELGPDSVINGRSPNSFQLYNSKSQDGWLVLSPQRALLVDVSKEQPDILVGLLQPADTDRGGVHSDYYRSFLWSVMLWVSNQDAQEPVDQIKELVESGRKSVDGQVWLSLALAVIGILIAILLPDPHQAGRLIASVTILCLASICFWGYAHWARMVWLVVGLILVLMLVLCLFLWPQLVSLFELVKHLPLPHNKLRIAAWSLPAQASLASRFFPS